MSTFSKIRCVASRYGAYGWAAVDQALFSLAAFGSNVLLARALPASEYGIFAVAQSLFLLVVGFQNALFVEPLSVFGAHKYAARQRDYFRVLLGCNAVFGAFAAGLMMLWRLILPTFGMDGVLPTLAGAMPFMLLIWMLRRFYYVDGRVTLSVAQSGAYGVLAVTVIALLSHLRHLSAGTAYSALALASLLASSPTVLSLIKPRRPQDAPLLRPVLRDHWGFGRWVVAGTILSAVAAQGQIILAAGLGGYQVAGSLRALSNLTMPVFQLINGVAALVIPTMARKVGRGDVRGAVNVCWAFTAAAGFSAAFSGLIMSVYAKPLVHYVCGEAYDADATLVPLLAVAPVISAVGLGMPILFRALNRPSYLMITSAANSAVSVVASALLIPRFGVKGVVFGMITAAGATAVASGALYGRWRIACGALSSAPSPARLIERPVGLAPEESHG